MRMRARGWGFLLLLCGLAVCAVLNSAGLLSPVSNSLRFIGEAQADSVDPYASKDTKEKALSTDPDFSSLSDISPAFPIESLPQDLGPKSIKPSLWFSEQQLSQGVSAFGQKMDPKGGRATQPELRDTLSNEAAHMSGL